MICKLSLRDKVALTSFTYIVTIDKRLYTLETFCRRYRLTQELQIITGFPGPLRGHQTSSETWHSSVIISVSLDVLVSWMWSFTRKRNFFLDFPAMFPELLDLLLLCSATIFDDRCMRNTYVPVNGQAISKFRNINPTPFQCKARSKYNYLFIHYNDRSNVFYRSFCLLLRTNWPMLHCTQPVFTLVFKGLVQIFTSTTKVCTCEQL